MISESLQRYLESYLQVNFREIRPVTGGDIHQAFRLTAADGRQWFVKTNRDKQAATMFKTESQGLALLGASRAIRVPKVYRHGSTDDGQAYPLMEYVVPGYRNRVFWERFGQGPAYRLQRGADLGLPQSNSRHDSWAGFYAEERLWPQMLQAREFGYFDAAAERQLDALVRNLGWRCPEEQPALIHGDLWSGNFLCDTEGQPVLIDPAACFAHREMDLAMSRLFGGFDAAFYAAYEEAWPLEPGFPERLEIYHLYYLLVHVNLFGGGYVGQVQAILNRFS